ncbi:MAG: ABC transporter permease [Planctomycetota bacterium]
MDSRSADLPPLTVIRPAEGWTPVDFGELWRYRDLFVYLSWRNVAIRYKQTLFGILWALLQPLVQSGIFAIFLGHFAKMPSDGQPYFLFALCGMLPWSFFRESVNTASVSMVASTDLVTKVYFPRIWIPASAVMVGLVDFCVAMGGLLAVLVLYWYKGLFSWTLEPTILLVPLLLLIMLALGLGLGMIFTALNVRYRDVKYAVPFLLQCGLFATPVVYPASIIEAPWRSLLGLNPMAGVVETFRAIVLTEPAPWDMLVSSGAAALLVLAIGLKVFRRMESHFADVI